MWSALDWTGMLTTGEGTPDASAPSDKPGATAIPTARPVDKKKRMSSSRTIHAEAIEVIADPDKIDKAAKDWDSNSDTGSETDSDSDVAAAMVKENRQRKRTCICLILALFFAAIVSGSFHKKARVEEEESTTKTLGFTETATNYSCSANETADFESADVILNLDGMEREATETEIVQVQDSVTSVYNEVSDGCDDIYERIMANATIVEQALVEDSKGAKHLTMGIKTTLACDGCAEEDEILFGGDDEDDTRRERKLRSGVRGIRGNVLRATGGGRRQRILKSSKKSVNSQEFIDELDATLQASGLPLTNVKEGYVYEQKDGKKKKDKVKLAPTKTHKEDKKHPETTEEIYKGDLKQDERRKRRN